MGRKEYELSYTDATKPLPHFWEMCVGSCHAATALREDYREQLTKCHRELGFRYVRFHGLFDDDMSVLTAKGGPMQRESDGEYILSFTNTDSVFDFLLSIGMKPFVELGFMPEALTTGQTTIFHYKGHTAPPDDYGKWEWLIGQFAAHCVERYGLDEVRQWFFEVWNEPNLGGPGAPMGFWGGSMEEYFKLYESAARGLKKVDHALRVGGPATADNAWVPELIQFCQENAVPLDFITTHHYPTDVVLGYSHAGKRMSIKDLMDNPDEEAAQQALKEMLEMRETMWKQIPRGTVTQMAREVKGQAGDYPVYYTEWNSGAGIDSDGPFGSSFIAKAAMDNYGLVEGYSYWTFTDIFEEGGMPHTPFHGGFGLLNLQGIPKGTYRAFELLHRLGGETYEKQFAEGTVDVYAVKKAESSALQLLLVNHQSLLQEIAPEEIHVKLSELPGVVKVTVTRVDAAHGNALARWRELGEPDYLDERLRYELLAASCIKEEELEVSVAGDGLEFDVAVPEQGIALVTVYL